MTTNTERPVVDPEWASSRNTHIAVATAIHAIAPAYGRSAEAIWAGPTDQEKSDVVALVGEYQRQGAFPRAAMGDYHWGETIAA
jgi:hypothetical protein